MISYDEEGDVGKMSKDAMPASYFTILVLQNGKHFGKFNTKALGEEHLIGLGWKASAIKGAYYKDNRSAIVVPWTKPLPLEDLEK